MKDKNYFDLSDAKKKRIIKKAARDGAEMQKETRAKASRYNADGKIKSWDDPVTMTNGELRDIVHGVRKQAITDAIGALEMKKESVVLAGGWSKDANGNPIAGTLRYDHKKLAEGIGFNRAVVLLEARIAALKEREGIDD